MFIRVLKINKMAEKKRKHTDEEIKQMADDFYKEHMEPYFAQFEMNCEICGRRNCKDNETCIDCGCQL